MREAGEKENTHEYKVPSERWIEKDILLALDHINMVRREDLVRAALVRALFLCDLVWNVRRYVICAFPHFIRVSLPEHLFADGGLERLYNHPK